MFQERREFRTVHPTNKQHLLSLFRSFNMFYNNNNSNNNNSYRRPDSGGGSSSNNRPGGGRRRSSVDTLPLEQGIICSLKDSFGFIHCAERPEEIFFHYSEVTSCHPDELEIDTEVEFRVGGGGGSSDKDGSSNNTKRTAYAVCTLEPGTVVWETEEVPEALYRGLIEREIRMDSRGGGGGGGGRDARTQEGSIQVVVLEEESPDSTEGTTKKGPIVRFRPEDVTLDKKSRNNRLFRGDLVEFRIFLDRRTKQKYARHIVLLQTEKERTRAERERKLLESAVEEEGMVISLNNGFGFLKTNKRVEHVYFHFSHLREQDTDLKKGQEMKFLVVTETVDGQSKCAARRLECLPKGSVQFHTVVARGVKGTVTMCPRPPSAGNDRGYADDKNGSIRLLLPLIDTDSDGKKIEVIDVSLEFNDAPGGVYTYQQRSTTTSGLWIVEGDILLFDVVKELADGSYQAAPTNHTLAAGGAIEEPQGDMAASADVGAQIRLVACSLICRAEGTIQTFKGQGGFIAFAERPADARFQTYNILPEELASDLRKQLGYPGDVVNPMIGVGAHFDMFPHTGGGRRRADTNENEHVTAHRILLLPPSAVPTTKILAEGAKGVIKSSNTKALYSGLIDIEDEITPMALEERYPLVSKMIYLFIEESALPHGRKQLVYRDALKTQDDEVVVELVKTKAHGVLTYDHIPVAGMDPRLGRLIIKRAEVLSDSYVLDKEVSEKPDTQKKRQGNATPSKGVRFDRDSLSEESKKDLPPNAGDIISCDVVQSRRTGKIGIQNLKVVERYALSAEEAARIASRNATLEASEIAGCSGLGVVQNVVPKSGFGFISVFNENAVRQELLFFSLTKDNSKKSQFKKGDEVKFHVGTDPRTGKNMAQNVEIVPIGTIPSKPAKNACRGIILMEPTHTRLSDTPVRKTPSGDSSGGRWANTKDEPHKAQAEIHENGVILLLEDLSGMFHRKRKPNKRESGESNDSADDNNVGDAGADNESMDDEKSVGSSVSSDESHTGGGLTHLTYKTGAIAIHGAGAAGGMDAGSYPKRGDIVTFTKARKGMQVRDIRIEKRRAATFVRGRLENITVENTTGSKKKNSGSAIFVTATENEEKYEIDLCELVSCDAALLQEKQQAEGILHEGRIHGVCRTSDLYLESKLGLSQKERPKLNLAVKKDRGGKIFAQSHMAKGPDGTNGFAAGWTSRNSQYEQSAL